LNKSNLQYMLSCGSRRQLGVGEHCSLSRNLLKCYTHINGGGVVAGEGRQIELRGTIGVIIVMPSS